jgi:hypothetical protein
MSNPKPIFVPESPPLAQRSLVKPVIDSSSSSFHESIPESPPMAVRTLAQPAATKKKQKKYKPLTEEEFAQETPIELVRVMQGHLAPPPAPMERKDVEKDEQVRLQFEQATDADWKDETETKTHRVLPKLDLVDVRHREEHVHKNPNWEHDIRQYLLCEELGRKSKIANLFRAAVQRYIDDNVLAEVSSQITPLEGPRLGRQRPAILITTLVRMIDPSRPDGLAVERHGYQLETTEMQPNTSDGQKALLKRLERCVRKLASFQVVAERGNYAELICVCVKLLAIGMSYFLFHGTGDRKLYGGGAHGFLLSKDQKALYHGDDILLSFYARSRSLRSSSMDNVSA